MDQKIEEYYVRCMFVRNCRNDAAAVPVADITYAQI